MKRNTIVLIALFPIIVACTFHMQPQVSKETLKNNKEIIPLTLLLVIPEDFKDYEYVASYEGREIRYFFGNSMKEIMPVYMESMFSKVVMAGNNKPNDYDYMAIPNWGQSNSYVKPFTFGIETNIKIQFISKDRNSSFVITGKGEGQAGIYTESALEEAGNNALNGSLKNIRKKIEASKEQFVK